MTPTTFTRHRMHVVTILSPAHGSTLPGHIKEFCALSLARNSRTHAEAVERIIAHGLARDAAEADELIAAGEDNR